MHRTFTTPEPLALVVEIQAGSVTIEATEVTETTVDVTSPKDAAEPVRIELDGRTLRVIGPKTTMGAFWRTHPYDVRLTVPTGSSLRLRTGSADSRLTGTFGAFDLRTGSGDVTISTVAESSTLLTGSGDVLVDAATAGLRATTGSGDILVKRATGPLRVKAGSGDVTVGTSSVELSAVTGSGGLRLDRAEGGQVTVRTGSGDVRIAVPDDLPVWTDVVAGGGVTSTLRSRGAAEAGQPYLTVRAQIGSGELRLENA